RRSQPGRAEETQGRPGRPGAAGTGETARRRRRSIPSDDHYAVRRRRSLLRLRLGAGLLLDIREAFARQPRAGEVRTVRRRTACTRAEVSAVGRFAARAVREGVAR